MERVDNIFLHTNTGWPGLLGAGMAPPLTKASTLCPTPTFFECRSTTVLLLEAFRNTKVQLFAGMEASHCIYCHLLEPFSLFPHLDPNVQFARPLPACRLHAAHGDLMIDGFRQSESFC
eukprot:GGOE01045651.1.p2 GENE.GGOE01045651.1~~GGOE01045651.1.p2  ORF type:complete len:119 (-),score=0.39 GGOE01045651.1:253-609(-)